MSLWIHLKINFAAWKYPLGTLLSSLIDFKAMDHLILAPGGLYWRDFAVNESAPPSQIKNDLEIWRNIKYEYRWLINYSINYSLNYPWWRVMLSATINSTSSVFKGTSSQCSILRCWSVARVSRVIKAKVYSTLNSCFIHYNNSTYPIYPHLGGFISDGLIPCSSAESHFSIHEPGHIILANLCNFLHPAFSAPPSSALAQAHLLKST